MNKSYWQLRAAARNYQDSHHQVTRIGNRLKALAKDGLTDPALHSQLEMASAGRMESGRTLAKIYQATAPAALVKFQRETPGIGEVLMAQLIGEIGDLRTYTEAWWAPDPTGKEKRVLETGGEVTVGVREIWAFCGHGDPTCKRVKGGTQDDMLAAGSPAAKTIIHMMADFAVRLNGVPDKNGRPRAKTPYYDLYIKAKTDIKAAHDDWTPLHCDNHGKRIVAKAMLKDFWRVQHDSDPVYGERTPWTPREEKADGKAG
jgi:hypothetical protein